MTCLDFNALAKSINQETVPNTESVTPTQREEQTPTAQQLADNIAQEMCENIKRNVSEFRKWMAENHPEYPY